MHVCAFSELLLIMECMLQNVQINKVTLVWPISIHKPNLVQIGQEVVEIHVFLYSPALITHNVPVDGLYGMMA